MKHSILVRIGATLALSLLFIVAITALAGRPTPARPARATGGDMSLGPVQPVRSQFQPVGVRGGQQKVSGTQPATQPKPAAPRPISVSSGDLSRADVPMPGKRPNGAAHNRPHPQTPAVAPANDNCANAIAVTPGVPFNDTVDTTGATDEAGEPQSTCTMQKNSVWYSFTNAAANSAMVTVETCMSNFDTAVMVWKETGASCDFANFSPVSCNDDFCGNGLQSTTTFIAESGATYKIQVGGFTGDTGNLTTNITSEVFNCPSQVVNGTLGSGSPDHAFVTGNQTGRLNRNGISSTCAAPKNCLIFTPIDPRAFDAYTFPNSSGADACTTVNLDVLTQTGANYQVNAYLDSYDPANICTNYLADPGLSTGSPPVSTTMSFVVPAGHSVVLVVHTTNPGETGGQYTLTVLGNLCGRCEVSVARGTSPAGYLPLSAFGIPPESGFGDDNIINFNVPPFTFAGETYTEVGFSSNGYVVVGGSTHGDDNQFTNESFPNTNRPNNVLAPFWTDLFPPGGGALRIAELTDGSDIWLVLDWEAVPEFGASSIHDSFQVWIGLDGDAHPGEDITFTYGAIENADGFATVGAENKVGTRGQNVFFNNTGTKPSAGTELRVTTTPCVTLSTQASPDFAALGATTSDSATIGQGINPTGTITFDLYGPNDATCGGTPVFSSTVPVNNGNGVYLSGNFTPTVAGTYRWVASYSGDAGNNPAFNECDDPNEITVITESVIRNLSTRMRVETGDNVGIGGFIVRGNVPKRVIIRAIGPDLMRFGLSGFLADPVLELHGGGAFATITNDNWRDTQQTEIAATGIPPVNDAESAIVMTLDPGQYTAIVRGKNGTTGLALVEVYDLDPSATSNLVNISTRAFVNTGQNLIIAGFILRQSSGNDSVVVRGLGPSLAAAGISSVLANPALQLRDHNGTLLFSNNDWEDDGTQAADIAGVGLDPSDPSEAAIFARIPAGAYTVLLTGENGGIGVGLVEVYQIGPTLR